MISIPIRLMAHLVAGYPTDAIAFAAAKGLVEGGVAYLEIQFPFSDPSADGKAIQSACALTLARNYRLSDGFDFVARLHATFANVPLFIMTYGNLAYRTGIEEFVRRAQAAGASGLIIPDLPFDTDEGLAQACLRYGLTSVPVAAPSMTEARIAQLNDTHPQFIYAALRSGITGRSTDIDQSTLEFLDRLGFSSRILGGFGIREGSQARALAPHVHAVVAGSVFVELISTQAPAGEEAVRLAVRRKADQLCSQGQDL